MSDKPFRTGRSSAKRAAKAQSLLIEKQRQSDELELAEQEDVIGRKKALAKKGGRSLLINTQASTAGRSNVLGGTT